MRQSIFPMSLSFAEIKSIWRSELRAGYRRRHVPNSSPLIFSFRKPTLYAWFLVMVLLATVNQSEAQLNSRTADDLVGLWTAVEDFGSSVHGEMIVDGRTSKWQARVAGVFVPVDRLGSTIRFSIPA